MTAGRFGASDVTQTHVLLITNVSKVVNSLFSDAFYHLRIGHKEIRKQAGPVHARRHFPSGRNPSYIKFCGAFWRFSQKSC